MHGHQLFGFRRLPRLIPILIVVLLVTAACGSNDSDEGEAAMDSEMAFTGAAPATASSAQSAEESASGGATDADQERSRDAAAQQTQAEFDRLVIRTAQINLSVEDVGSAVSSVRDLALTKGGFVFASSSYVADERQYAQVTIKVPAAQFDSTMNDLRNAPFVDEVEREESSSQDVSAEFVDNESRLAVLRETQARFLALLEQAETVEDILRLEYELQNVRSEIEQIQGRQNYLENATELSTITVSLAPAGAPAAPRTASGSFSVVDVFERAWEHSRGAIEGSLVVIITLSIYAAFMLPFAIIAWFVYRTIRGRTQRSSTGTTRV